LTLYNIPKKKTLELMTFHTFELFLPNKERKKRINLIVDWPLLKVQCVGEGWEMQQKPGFSTLVKLPRRSTKTSPGNHQQLLRLFSLSACRTKISRRNVKTFFAADNISIYIHLPINLVCIGAKHCIFIISKKLTRMENCVKY